MDMFYLTQHQFEYKYIDGPQLMTWTYMYRCLTTPTVHMINIPNNCKHSEFSAGLASMRATPIFKCIQVNI